MELKIKKYKKKNLLNIKTNGNMGDKSNEKIFVEKRIFREQSQKPFKWKDIKHVDLQDDDTIVIGYDEGYYSENNSWDPHYYVTITRMVLETDEQFEKRQKELKRDAKWARESSFKSYQHFKKKFEGCCNYCGSPDGSCTDVEAETCENYPKN
jgi:hypothetical protein